MRKKILLMITLCVVGLNFLMVSSGGAAVCASRPFQVQYKVEVHGNGDRIVFSNTFNSVPVVITSAQWGGKALSSCAVNVTKKDFQISIHNENGNAVTKAWVQWIAIIPKPSAQVLGGIIKASDHQRISFPVTLSKTPVIITNAQKNRTALSSCAVSNAPNGFYLALRDHNNNPVSNAWLLWLAVVPSETNGFKGAVAKYNNGANISFSPPFATGPVYVLSAQNNWEPYAAGAVSNKKNGFTLSLIRHNGSTGSGVWTQWLGYAGVQVAGWLPYANRYAVIVMGGPANNDQQYGYYWMDTYGMYQELRNLGFSDGNIYFLSWGTQADSHSAVVDKETTKANVQWAFNQVKSRSRGNDLVYIFWVDHGNNQLFKLPGDDITHAEYNNCIRNITAKVIIGAYNPCYSGAVINDISRSGVISITSVNNNQRNRFGWAGKWRDALKGGTSTNPSDKNNDGYISMAEAYEWVAPKSQAYSPKEHPWFDDNGDGGGSEYGTAGYDPNNPNKDGWIGSKYSLTGWGK